ncbi:MAG: NYN domain-containing protein [Chthoniobacterales bacterium]
MSARVLIVDGHSVIFQWEDLRRTHTRNTANARDKLIQILTRYQDCTGIHVAVVFDGKGCKVGRADEPHGIQVFYSKSGQTADTIIERLVAKYGQTFQIEVVTDDNMERQTVATFGATTLSTALFRQHLSDADKDLAARIKHLR